MAFARLPTDRFKYIRYEELEGMDEMYDLERDPRELQNLPAPGDGYAAGGAEGEVRELADRLGGRLERMLDESRSLPPAWTDALAG